MHGSGLFRVLLCLQPGGNVPVPDVVDAMRVNAGKCGAEREYGDCSMEEVLEVPLDLLANGRAQLQAGEYQSTEAQHCTGHRRNEGIAHHSNKQCGTIGG